MRSHKELFLILSFLSAQLFAINADDLTNGKHFKHLSEYGFFKDLKNQVPEEGVLPYELKSQLFSDYTHKKRFIYMPEGSKLAHAQDKVFQFPVGTTLIKTFFYENAASDLNAQLLETRLLIHTNNGWEAVGYIWNDEQSDAQISLVGKTINTTFSKENGELISIRYRAPNKNQCKECHQLSGVMTPIGPKARNLDLDVEHDNQRINQLEKWAALGWIEKNLKVRTMANYKDLNQDINLRARSYLEINCAHCHIEGGSADTTGLFLTLEENQSKHLGFFKKPVATGKGSFNLDYSIVPGKSEESILLARMQSLDPSIMMPESGRTLQDKEGLEIVRDWIDSL